MEYETLDFSQARIVEPNTEPETIVLTETGTTETAEPAATEPTAEGGENTTPETTPETAAAETSDAEASTTVAETETIETDTQQESPDDAFNRMFQERYGATSLEEYLELMEQERQPQFSETVQKLIEWESKGLNPEDYFRTQKQDFDAMSELDRVRNLYALDFPDYSPEDIDLLIEDEFKINEEDYDEKTVRLGQLKLKQKAKEALGRLKEWQVEAATPVEDTQAQQLQAQVESYQRQVDNDLRDFNAIEIPLNDKGEKFTYSIAADKKGVEAMVKDVNTFFADFTATDAQGNQQYKVKEMAQALYIGKNWQKIAKALAAHTQGLGVKQVEREINNTSNTTQKAAETVQQNTPMHRLSALSAKGLI